MEGGGLSGGYFHARAQGNRGQLATEKPGRNGPYHTGSTDLTGVVQVEGSSRRLCAYSISDPFTTRLDRIEFVRGEGSECDDVLMSTPPPTSSPTHTRSIHLLPAEANVARIRWDAVAWLYRQS